MDKSGQVTAGCSRIDSKTLRTTTLRFTAEGVWNPTALSGVAHEKLEPFILLRLHPHAHLQQEQTNRATASRRSAPLHWKCNPTEKTPAEQTECRRFRSSPTCQQTRLRSITYRPRGTMLTFLARRMNPISSDLLDTNAAISLVHTEREECIRP